MTDQPPDWKQDQAETSVLPRTPSPSAEPVAWRMRHGTNSWTYGSVKITDPDFICEPLYASPVSDARGREAVTDAMCEAAVKAAHIDRIQGFTYKTHHVIRDVFKDFGEQQIWAVNKDDADAEDKFYHQCRVEKMRVILNAALSPSFGKTGGGK